MTTIVERISALHRKLCEDPEYRKYVTAKNDSDAVEGALYIDTFRATEKLRRAAVEAGDAGLAGLKLQDIADALNELIGRKIDKEKLEREAQKTRMAYHGLDDDDLARLKALDAQRNKPQ